MIITGRDAQKAREFINSLSRDQGRMQFIECDFSDLQNVKKLSKEINSSCDKVDILINNAGLCKMKFSQNPQGLEQTMAINHLAHFMLTSDMMELLSKSSGVPRIVNVSSRAHEHGGSPLNVTGGIEPMFEDQYLKEDKNQKSYDFAEQYGRSKLANIHFTKGLEAYSKKTGVALKTACLHPGVISSDFFREFGNDSFYYRYQSVISPILNFFIKTPEEGAQTTLFCALASDDVIQ